MRRSFAAAGLRRSVHEADGLDSGQRPGLHAPVACLRQIGSRVVPVAGTGVLGDLPFRGTAVVVDLLVAVAVARDAVAFPEFSFVHLGTPLLLV